MSGHDPLCSPEDIYQPGTDHEDEFCHCELVARVRADERERLREQVEAYERAALYGNTREAYRRVIDLLGGDDEA